MHQYLKIGESLATFSKTTKFLQILFPTLALPKSGAVEVYTSSQTVHRLPYMYIMIAQSRLYVKICA